MDENKEKESREFINIENDITQPEKKEEKKDAIQNVGNVNTEASSQNAETVKQESNVANPPKAEAKPQVAQPQINSQQFNPGVKQSPYGLNIAALVLGIVSLVLWCFWYVSIPCAILAFIFGIIGIKKNGKGMAISGIVTGAIALVLWIVLFVFCFVVGFTMGLNGTLKGTSWSSSDYYDLFSDYYDF